MNVTVATAVLVVAVNVNVAAVNTMASGIGNLWGSAVDMVTEALGISGSADMNFANQWGDNYHGKADDDKRKRAFDVLQSDFTVPTEAVDSINKSAFIFDGDMGFDSETIKDNMTKIGAIESNYTTKVQEDEGPARSYWQVEPSTAKSLLNNSSALFGPKFNEVFAQYAEGDRTASEVLADKSTEDLQTLIENDSDLGAAFATAKMITTFET
jgi:hypothetical protein